MRAPCAIPMTGRDHAPWRDGGKRRTVRTAALGSRDLLVLSCCGYEPMGRDEYGLVDDKEDREVATIP